MSAPGFREKRSSITLTGTIWHAVSLRSYWIGIIQTGFGRPRAASFYFTPPAFAFRDRYLRGVNGRHRAILLFRHLDVIPMLLVLAHEWPKEKLAEIMEGQIGGDDIVALPDLPINKSIVRR